jgi:hypothetical protein
MVLNQSLWVWGERKSPAVTSRWDDYVRASCCTRGALGVLCGQLGASESEGQRQDTFDSPICELCGLGELTQSFWAQFSYE